MKPNRTIINGRILSINNPLHLLLIQLWINLILSVCQVTGKPFESKFPSPKNELISLSRRYETDFWGSSGKYLRTCHEICSQGLTEGLKYCNCLREPFEAESVPQGQYLNYPPEGFQSASLQPQSLVQERPADYQMPISHVNYFTPQESPPTRCSFRCSENPDEASKYCFCQNENLIDVNPSQMMTSSEQASSPSQQQLTLLDYLKLDPSTGRQLCPLLCQNPPFNLNNQLCDCEAKKSHRTKKMGIKSKHSIKSQLTSELGKPDSTSNPFAIKSILNAAVDSDHRSELCSYVCALEPKEAANNQCDCNNSNKPAKSIRTKFPMNPWRSIKNWLG